MTRITADDIANYEERLAEEDITFDLVRGILDDIKDARAEVAALRRQVEERRVVVTTSSGLLPCPFCGREPKIGPDDPSRRGSEWATVFCPDEECPGNHGSVHNNRDDLGHAVAVAEASKIWNRRIRTISPGEVVVGREEWEILRDGFGLLRTAWNISGFNERLSAQADALIERHDALRSGEAGKGAPHA